MRLGLSRHRRVHTDVVADYTIAPGDTVTIDSPDIGAGTLSGGRGETDRYTFTIPAGTQATLTGLQCDQNMDLLLFDPPTGHGVICDDTTPFRILDAGTYRLDVSNPGEVTQTYGFALSTVTSVETTHTDTVDVAQVPITANQRHVHHVDITEAGEYVLDLAGCAGGGEAVIVDTYQRAGCGDEPQVVNLDAGRSSIEVRTTTTTSDSYSLTLTPRQVDEASIGIGVPASGSLGGGFDVDRWTLTIANHTTITIALDTCPSGADVTIRPQATVVDFVDDGDCTYTATVHPNQYTIEVTGFSGGYELAVGQP